jgi:hypothetical protein
MQVPAKLVSVPLMPRLPNSKIDTSLINHVSLVQISLKHVIP